MMANLYRSIGGMGQGAAGNCRPHHTYGRGAGRCGGCLIVRHWRRDRCVRLAGEDHRGGDERDNADYLQAADPSPAFMRTGWRCTGLVSAWIIPA